VIEQTDQFKKFGKTLAGVVFKYSAKQNEVRGKLKMSGRQLIRMKEVKRSKIAENLSSGGMAV